MTARLLHLVTDEKFIDFIIESFEYVLPNSSTYILPITNSSYRIKYISKIEKIRKVSYSFLFSRRMKDLMANHDAVIIHWMYWLPALYLVAIPKRPKIIWSGWGGDYYSLINDIALREAYKNQPRTSDEASNVRNKKSNRINYLIMFLVKKVRSKLSKCLILKAAKRIDYFSAPIPADYKYLKSNLHNFNARYLQINYGSIEDTIAIGMNEIIGNNILVGNSATISNQHERVFNYLLTSHISPNTKIIVPLSYGNSIYREHIVGIGYQMFGINFNPITKFLPLREYNNLLATCSVAVMGHTRQQALGNILRMLYLGAEIYLDPKNPVYNYLSELGAIVKTLDQLDHVDVDLVANAKYRVSRNREVLTRVWGREQVFKNIRYLSDCIEDNTQTQRVPRKFI